MLFSSSTKFQSQQLQNPKPTASKSHCTNLCIVQLVFSPSPNFRNMISLEWKIKFIFVFCYKTCKGTVKSNLIATSRPPLSSKRNTCFSVSPLLLRSVFLNIQGPAYLLAQNRMSEKQS